MEAADANGEGCTRRLVFVVGTGQAAKHLVLHLLLVTVEDGG